MLVPLALSVVPLVVSVPGTFKGRARIVHKSARESASAKTSATPSAKSPADVRLVNPYGTRAYVKWPIPLLFVHGVSCCTRCSCYCWRSCVLRARSLS